MRGTDIQHGIVITGEKEIDKKEPNIKLKLPRIFQRNGRECYLDPFREKLIYITPEETVRQKILYFLTQYKEIPAETIVVEQHLSHYGIKSKKRADIVVHALNKEGNISYPLLVVECKAPEVYLDEKAQNQLLEYCDLIGADYAMLVNGEQQYCFKYENTTNSYIVIEDIPTYGEMICGKYKEYNFENIPERIQFDAIEDYLKDEFRSCEPDEYPNDISKDTPMQIATAVFNLWDGLLDNRVKMPSGDYGIFKLIEDYGVRMISYGNSSGGKFYGPYRSFLIEIDGNTEFYSIGVSIYWKSATPHKVKTCISVAHDDEKNEHHALQLVADDNLIVSGKRVDFYHHGRIAVGRMGSGKIAELRKFVEGICPELIKGNKFFMGSIDNNRLWRLDDPEVIHIIANLISYSMIRDKYRDFVKKNR